MGADWGRERAVKPFEVLPISSDVKVAHNIGTEY